MRYYQFVLNASNDIMEWLTTWSHLGVVCGALGKHN